MNCEPQLAGFGAGGTNSQTKFPVQLPFLATNRLAVITNPSQPPECSGFQSNQSTWAITFQPASTTTARSLRRPRELDSAIGYRLVILAAWNPNSRDQEQDYEHAGFPTLILGLLRMREGSRSKYDCPAARPHQLFSRGRSAMMVSIWNTGFHGVKEQHASRPVGNPPSF